MADKWVEDLAEDIRRFAVSIVAGTENRGWLKENIEALILKHCPEGKAVQSPAWKLALAERVADISFRDCHSMTAVTPLSPNNVMHLIERYCPDDKAAEKLVEALREVKAECYGAIGRDGLSNKTCYLVDEALAEYEELKK